MRSRTLKRRGFSKTSELPNIIELVVKVDLGGGRMGQRHEPLEGLNPLLQALKTEGGSHEARNADGL